MFAPTWSARKQCLSCVPAKTPIFPVIWVLRERLQLSELHSSGHRVSQAPGSCATEPDPQVAPVVQGCSHQVKLGYLQVTPNHQQNILHIVGLTLQVVSGPYPLLD